MRSDSAISASSTTTFTRRSASVITANLVAASVLPLPLGVLDLPDSSFEWGPVLSILALGVVGTGLARAMHMTLIGRVGPTLVSRKEDMVISPPAGGGGKVAQDGARR